MHIYFNAFKQRIVLRRGYKARIKKISWYCIGIGIVLVLLIYAAVLYWYWWGEKPVLFNCAEKEYTPEKIIFVTTKTASNLFT